MNAVSGSLTRRAALAVAAALMTLALAAAAPTATPLPAAKPAMPSVKAAKPAAAVSGRAIADRIELSGNHGWMVVDLDTGRVIEQENPGRAFAAASVAKLPTAFYAIDTLGADFRFETVVVADGTLVGDRLEGDLALVGSGDPELDTDALQPLAEQAAAAGIERITGRFLVDASAGPRIVELDPGQPEDVTYNPSYSGLNLNYNRVRLEWDASKQEDAIKTTALGERLNPDVDGFVVAIDARPNIPVFDHSFGPGTEVWQMAKRAFRGKGSRWLPVRRPEIYAGTVFRDLAAKAGLTLPRPEPGLAPLPSQQVVVARSQGRRLTQVVKDMLKYSTNLTAEALGVRASKGQTGRAPGTLFESAQTMNDWASRLVGFPKNDAGFRFANHSGLSTVSRVSPQRMVGLLQVVAAREPAAQNPDPRIPGALSGLLKPHNVRDKGVDYQYDKLFVAAKTGTMNYVRGLAGFIRTPGGRNLAFAYFANDLSRRVGGEQATNKGWLARARQLERALIRHWATLADRA